LCGFILSPHIRVICFKKEDKKKTDHLIFRNRHKYSCIISFKASGSTLHLTDHQDRPHQDQPTSYRTHLFTTDTMIRRPTTHLHLHNNNSARPDPVTSISSNSVSKETTLCERHAIKKSDTFDSLNNRFESLDYNDHTNTCTTSRHLRLHDGRRHRSHFDEANSSEIHKVSQREECVCVCVCVRERERKRERGKQYQRYIHPRTHLQLSYIIFLFLIWILFFSK
jgi:hypothetical protein